MVREFLSSGPLPRAVLLDNIEAQGGNRISASHITSQMVKNGKIIRSKEKGQRVVFSLPESGTLEAAPSSVRSTVRSYLEKDFYSPFAEYLEYGDEDDDSRHLDECTKAIPLGGNAFGGKWGTPDVIGVLRPMDGDDVQFPHEIVSAEIKTDDSGIITAFGQACAYRLFSHKVYLVIPKPKDTGRIESLCHIYGIGLVYFDPAQAPHLSIFSLQQLAQRHSPDMLYVNEYIRDGVGNRDIASELYEKRKRRKR